MNLITWLWTKLGGASVPLKIEMDGNMTEYVTLLGDIQIREMAFWSAVNFISNAVSKCEFKTFLGNKEVKGAEYYLWNVEPNRNQNASGFIAKWLAQLYMNNEALIIDQNGQLLVADSFIRKPFALYEDIFTQVQVGDFTFDRAFVQSEVMYFPLGECDMRAVVSGIFGSYAKLIGYSMKAYQKSRGTKGKFKYEAIPEAGTEQRKNFDSLVSEKFKAFLEADNAIIPMGRGQDYTELSSRTYSNDTSRDIRALIDDVSDFTAKGFNIPPALLRGDVQGTKDAMEVFLTIGLDPLVHRLEQEINRKRYGAKAFTKGDYLRIDTNAVKHIDLLSVSTSIDKLISSGAFCINDIRRLVGESIIDEPWAFQHWMTKNNAVADVLATLEAGGTIDATQI